MSIITLKHSRQTYNKQANEILVITQRAIRSTSSKIANASNFLLSIPRSGVNAVSFNGQLLLSETDTSITVSVWYADKSPAWVSITGKAVKEPFPAPSPILAVRSKRRE